MMSGVFIWFIDHEPQILTNICFCSRNHQQAKSLLVDMEQDNQADLEEIKLRWQFQISKERVCGQAKHGQKLIEKRKYGIRGNAEKDKACRRAV